ncbi:MAG: hypothetical protein ACFE9L_00785 [Candidatus Hodarchaeota archaeon]
MTVEGLPTFPEYARSIVRAHYEPNNPNDPDSWTFEEMVDEILFYMNNLPEDKKRVAKFPRRTVELQIKAIIENLKVGEKKAEKKEKGSQNKRQKNNVQVRKKAEEPYQYAFSCIPLFNDSDAGWKTVLTVELQHQFPKLKFITAKSIVDKAYLDYEKVKDKKSESTPTHDLVDEKEAELSTSVETQVDSHEEIESRLYSFALNFLFNFQDPEQKILRSELIKTMNDYIKHHSLVYTEVQKLADEAIAEFREKSKATPEFKTAYQEYYKTEEKIEQKPEKNSTEILEQVIDDVLTSDSSSTIPDNNISSKLVQPDQSSRNDSLQEPKVFLVKCPSCGKEQHYTPKKTQERRRRNCSLCKKKFTINSERILKVFSSIDEIKTPPSVSIPKQSRAPSAKKSSKNQKSIISETIDFVHQVKGDSKEKESLIKLLKKYASKNSQNDFFSKNTIKGVQGVGGPSNGNTGRNVHSTEDQSNGHHSELSEERIISNNGHANGHAGHDIEDHFKNQKPMRGESGSKKVQSSSTRGGMTIDKNGHARKNSHDLDGHASRDLDDPGPEGPNHSNDENPEKGIYVVHTPLEFVHLQFKDEVGRLYDHRLAMFENLSPRRFGITQTLADTLRQMMDPPHYNDPAKQYRKKILGEFVFILTKDNTCIFYPKHPFSDLEFFKWIQNHLTKNQMRNLAYSYSLAVSAQKNELATPRIKNLTDEDPFNFIIKVELDNPDHRFFVRRDHSKGDAIEVWGPTRLGEAFLMRYLEPVIEHAISVQTHDKVKELRGRLLSQDSYLRDEIPKLQYELGQNGHILLQLKNKHRVVRALSDHLRDYFAKSLAQGEQHADILAEIKQGLQDQTIELVKTVRESLGGKLVIINSMLDPRITLRERILEIIRKNPGLNRKEIHQHFKIKRGCVNGIVK